ncbi:MAG: histidine kinase [Bacteroidia bacterium]|nr:histidine kinase [Bacteroidia bacterium]
MSLVNSKGYSRFTRYKLHHFAFWLAYFFFWYFFYNQQLEGGSSFVTAFITISIHGLMVYFNMYFLFSRLFKQRQYISYVVSVVLTVLLASLIWAMALNSLSIITNHAPLRDIWSVRFFTACFASITYSLAITMSLKMVKQWYERERVAENLERINMETELKYLKTQINPHFLFNSLNSLYALTLQKSEKAPELVLKLSEILRYVLYDGSERWVSLEKEISYLQSYLDLEKIRNGDRLNLEFNIKGDPKTKQIAPMLFLTFLENSFKHGINQKAEGGFVKIDMDIEDKHLDFSIENSRPKEKEKRLNGKSGGIGLENIKKRLALLYPDLHKLEIDDDGDNYRVKLNLSLERPI